jgi:hypothetical protein
MFPEAFDHLSEDGGSKRYTYELLISSINTTPRPLACSPSNISTQLASWLTDRKIMTEYGSHLTARLTMMLLTKIT